MEGPGAERVLPPPEAPTPRGFELLTTRQAAELLRDLASAVPNAGASGAVARLRSGPMVLARSAGGGGHQRSDLARVTGRL